MLFSSEASREQKSTGDGFYAQPEARLCVKFFNFKILLSGFLPNKPPRCSFIFSTLSVLAAGAVKISGSLISRLSALRVVAEEVAHGFLAFCQIPQRFLSARKQKASINIL